MGKTSKLSKQSEEFLENLSVYLFSSGKKLDESEEILDELRAHLFEAEQNGKSVEHIIGESPKEYIESISNEMPVDYRSWMKYILLIIFGSFSFIIFQDLVKGTLSYSVLEIAGHMIIALIFIGTIFMGFRYIATANLGVEKRAIILFLIMLLPISLFVGLIYLNKAIETPVLHLGMTGSYIIGIMTTLFIIAMSIWAKTWVLFIVILLLILPDFVLGMSPIKYETQLILGSLITFGGFALYFFVLVKSEKKKQY